MAGFKQPDFIERQAAAAKARKAALEKFLAKNADSGLAERLTERTARAAERGAIETSGEIEKAKNETRETERAQQAKRDAAIAAERAKAEHAKVERAKAEHAKAEHANAEHAKAGPTKAKGAQHKPQAKQKAAGDARDAARKSPSKKRR